MRRVAVIGAEGFVGSAFAALLGARTDIEIAGVTRANYERLRGASWDVVVDCSGNSRKYLADEAPLENFQRTVLQRLRTLLDYPAALQVHVSSVDVYNDLASAATTREEVPINPSRSSRYGFHKWLAEQLVRHYAPHWLIVRLAGMVGPGLRKNPVYDVLNERPLMIHPDSRYQYLSTADAARLIWQLVENGLAQEVYNVCGRGLVTPREIAELSGRSLDLSRVAPSLAPRTVDVCVEKLQRHVGVPETRETISKFLRQALPAAQKA